MHGINFKLVSENWFDWIPIPGEQVPITELKKIIAKRKGIKQEELLLKDLHSGQAISMTAMIVSGSQIYGQRQRISKPIVFGTNAKEEIKLDLEYVSRVELQKLCENAKFYVIRSCNQDNINVAKQMKKWATTINNERKLAEMYNMGKAVFFLFTTSKSMSFQGLAQMSSAPEAVPDKSIWKNVEKISLGGNFNIRWIRDGEAMYSALQNYHNRLTGDSVIRSRDCQQVTVELGLLIAKMLPQPQPPEIQPQMQIQQPAEEQKILTSEIDYDLIFRVSKDIFAQRETQVDKKQDFSQSDEERRRRKKRQRREKRNRSQHRSREGKDRRREKSRDSYRKSHRDSRESNRRRDREQGKSSKRSKDRQYRHRDRSRYRNRSESKDRIRERKHRR